MFSSRNPRRGGGGGGGGGGGPQRVTGNAETGLFTAGGRERMGGSGPSGSSSGGGGGAGPARHSSRRGGRRGDSFRGPHGRTSSVRGEDTDMGGDGERKKNSSPYQRPGRSTRSTSAPLPQTEGGITVYKRVIPSGDGIVFEVPDIVQAKALRRMGKFRFQSKDATMKVDLEDSMMGDLPGQGKSKTSLSRGTIDTIRLFIQSRHQNGFLNLENMASDEILLSGKILPPGVAKNEVGAVMMKVAAELFPDIETISFASNNLRSLNPVSAISQYLPNVKNLSFQNNQLTNYRDLACLSGSKKLPKLRELILLDNPIRGKEKDEVTYRSEITKMFPSLQMLDQLPVAKISFGIGDIIQESDKASKRLPAPIRRNFYDSPQTQATVEAFLTKFFDLFDNNRRALADIYDVNATFSMQVVTQTSQLMKKQGKSRPDDFSDYLAYSRNLSRYSDLETRTSRLHVGSGTIIRDGLLKLPRTKHDLSDAAKGRSKSPKSYDRSFILAPAPPGSSAQQQGWPCVIISDVLTVRSYNGFEAWKPEPELEIPNQVLQAVTPQLAMPNNVPTTATTTTTTAAAAAVAAAAAAAPNNIAQALPTQEIPPGITPEHHAMVLELQRQTRLTYPFAVQCLEASQWNIVNGVALVNRERANIPAEAFMAP
ncbi:nuclear mRNA export, poly(A)+RNA binding protein [Actinomortierella ambigua]|uniref:Nuclear mRNA export, poly(A)+RNA binding protein n=1 Tax=Actinomortierella ambigua TaxID=1343610 RepID=A0A9P6QMC2_9FUNG|nr:nuclear mRNA export, poly(A)+RNA binding protein [Actinomortierella ambigua]